MSAKSFARYTAVTVLIAAFAVQVLPPLFTKSGVCDEHGVHLPSGYVYWQSGVFSGGINNPPLMQLLVAAPLALGGHEYTPFSDDRLWAARLPVLALSIVLGLAVYAWAGSLYGRAAAPAALFLYCFEPNLIAHSGLATLDLGVTFFLFLAFFFVWRSWCSGRTSAWVAACTAMVLALLCKFTALLVLPAFLVLLVPALCRRIPPARRLRRSVLALAFLCACTVALSHLLYHLPIRGRTASTQLQGAGVEAASPSPDIGVDREDASGPERVASLLLPDLFVDGTLGKLRHAGVGHFSYLAGRRSMDGWWYYFLAALSLKTPIPLLAAFMISLISGAGLKGKAVGAAFVLVPMVFFVAAMSWTGVDIGVRHVLLFYPFAAVVASGIVARGFPRNRAALALIALGAVWHAGGSLRVHPDYLAYFNEIAGGPSGGSRYLIDSNIDWGQDEGLLMRFISESRDSVLVNPGAFAPSVGTVAVNVNSLRGVFRGDDNAYKWLEPFVPDRKLGYTWYVYHLDVDDYAEAVRASPTSPDRKVWLASVLRKSGRLEEALAVSMEIVEEFPDRRGNAWFSSGWWLLREGRFAEAERALAMAVEEGAGDEAVEALTAARVELKREGGSANGADFAALADFYARNELEDRAFEAIEEGIAAAPENGWLHLEKGMLLGRRGDYAGALEESSAAVEFSPRLSRARQLVGWAGHMLEMERSKNTYEAQMELGSQEYRFGRPAGAAVHFWNALLLNPSSSSALSAMGEIIVQAKLGVLKLETPWDARWPV